MQLSYLKSTVLAGFEFLVSEIGGTLWSKIFIRVLDRPGTMLTLKALVNFSVASYDFTSAFLAFVGAWKELMNAFDFARNFLIYCSSHLSMKGYQYLTDVQRRLLKRESALNLGSV